MLFPGRCAIILEERYAWSRHDLSGLCIFAIYNDLSAEGEMPLLRWLKRGNRQMGEELTQKDVEKIEKEIEYRKLVVRKEAIEAVKEARAQGDLSENFEYYAAKKDKNQNESRIRYLERMLKNARVISEDSREDEVGLNNTVQVYFEEDDMTETYKVVTSIRGNSLKGLISIESPLGRALLGHKVNDRIHIKVDEDYGYDVIIKSIENTVDDGSDSIRKF